ncbi:MAG: ABC transporter substrate-binding protein [Treponema sp.]|nr:ABC transporter substrate-binding protein [Treponema sp.]
MKKTGTLFMMVLLFLAAGCSKKTDSKTAQLKDKQFVASTSWTAGFMDIAGIDGTEIIAPANLRHPPEYEITVSDIQRINESSYFVYAGFERMMKTLAGAVTDESKMIKIKCDNSIETVSSESRRLAEIFGTQDECEKRLKEYCYVIEEAKKKLEKEGLKNAKVFCNKNQIYLAKDLGLEVIQTFGPGEVTSDQIAFAKLQNFVFIIDNIHNPVGTPLSEVAPEAKYIVWRNFPESVERGSLKKVISNNINLLFK